MDHGRNGKGPRDAVRCQAVTRNVDTGYQYTSSSNPSVYDAVRDLSTMSHLSRSAQQPLSPGSHFEQTDAGAASTALSAELERRYAGQHPLLHGSHFSYAMGNLPTGVPPLGRLGFSDALDYARFGVRSSASQSGCSVGMSVSRYGLDRSEGFEYDRSQLSGLMGQGHALFGSGQAAGALQMQGFSENKDDGAYFSVTSHLSPEENLPRESSVDMNQFDRGRLSASPQGSRRSTYDNSGQLNLPRDSFSGGSAPDTSPFFVSRQRSSPHSSSPQACPDVLSNFTQRQGAALAEGRSHLESAGRYQSHFSTSVPSFIPLGSASNYVYCNSPMVSSVRSFNPPLPQSTYNSGSPFDRLQSSDVQFSAPPPAHSVPPAHAHVPDVVLQRCGFSEGEKKQFAERNLYDATFPLSQSQGRNSSYGHGSTINSQRENDLVSPAGDTFCMKSQTDPKDEQQQMSAETETAPGRHTMNKAMLKNEMYQRERARRQNEPISQTARKHLLEGDSFSHVAVHAHSMKMDASFSAGNETSIIPEGGERFLPQQKTQKDMLGSPDSSFSVSSTADSFIKENTLPPSQRERCQTPPTKRVQSVPFTVTPTIYSDSSDGEEEMGIEEEPVVQKSMEYKTKIASYETAPSEVDNKGRGTEVYIPKRVSTGVGTTSANSESELYNSSTSEYEALSPCDTSAKDPTPAASKGKKTQRKQHCRTSIVKELDDGMEEGKPPRIKLIIRKERPKKISKANSGVTKTLGTEGQEQSGSKGPNTSGTVKGKKGNRTCPICQKTFSRADSLTCHMRVHTGDRPYVCEYCSASYKVSSHLRDHVRSKHTNTVPYECEKCNKTFTYSTAKRRHEKVCGKDLSERVEFQCVKCEKGFVTAKGYEKHQKKCNELGTTVGGIKDEEMPFGCIVCDRRFATFPGLDRHQRFLCGRSPQKGRYICEECGKVFLKRNRYITHTRRHAGDKPFKCPQCEACFYDNPTLQRHVNHHDGSKKFKCSVCDAAYFLRHCLSLHIMRAHCGLKPYKCSECELVFSSGYQLSRHSRQAHGRERRFKCMLCGKGFFEPSGWVTHMRLHALSPHKPVKGRIVKQLTCKLCGKSFFKKDLGAHVESEHPGATLQQVCAKELAKCEICCKDFTCRDSLRVHKLRHSGRKPYKCDQCNMAFMLKSALTLHQRKHTDYCPYGCPKCGQMFRLKASVTQHLLYHHGAEGEKDSQKFTCPECGKLFKLQICLNLHMKRHCSVMPHVCRDCGKGFVELTRLKIHMSKHDGPKPFMCEACGAGFFYRYLLDDHTRKKHSGIPKKSWLCEECGKSLSRKDSLLHHMSLHAKYPDGSIPQKGRRKGVKYPQKLPGVAKLKRTAHFTHSAVEQAAEVRQVSDSGMMQIDSSTNVGTMTDSRPTDDLADLPVTNTGQLGWTMPTEEVPPYQFSTYIHHTIPWPKPEAH